MDDNSLTHALDELSLKTPNENNKVVIKNTLGSSIIIEIYKDHEKKIDRLEFSTIEQPNDKRVLPRTDLFGAPEITREKVEIEVSKSPDNKTLRVTVKRPVTSYDLLHTGCVIEASEFVAKRQTKIKPSQIHDFFRFKYAPIDSADVDHTSPPPCCNSCGKDPSRLDGLCCEICIAREASYEACTADQDGSEQGLPENASQK